MTPYRGLLVWGIGIVVVLGVFLGFVAGGWPGAPDTCLSDSPNTCFCEAYDEADVLAHRPGVRQPVNTWFNVYAIFTSLIVAVVLLVDRRRLAAGAASPNLMRSNTLVPDLYVFAVLFLGLGSMWFHASLTKWGSVFDGMSMYIYASFLVFYSVRRMWDSGAFFWLAYLGTVLLFTFGLHGRIPSFVNIGILVVAYLVLEAVIWGRTKKVMQGTVVTVALWVSAVVAILLATLFWALSQTDGPMCDPTSGFQPHGMLWHPLAGVMAVLLYFYWREASDPV